MKESRFIRLLETFDKKEMNGFSHYLQCFHPKKERAILLYQYLEKEYPRFPAKNLTLELMNQAVYENENVIPKNILNLLSSLYGWAKDFLIWQHQLNSPIKKELLWLDVLKNRQMDHEFKLQAELTTKTIEQQQASNIWDYLDRLNLYHQIWTHPSTQRHTPSFEVLDKSLDNLDRFYTTFKMNYEAEKLNRTHLYQNQSSKKTPAEHICHAGENQEDLLTRIAKLQLNLAKDQKEENYLQLKNILFSYSTQLAMQTQSIMLQHLINYTAAGIRGKHKSNFYKEAFQLYEYSLQAGLPIYNGPITSHTFSNIISTALWLDKTNWVEKFIDDYTPFIDPAVQKQTELLARAHLAFHKKDHNSPYFRELQAIIYTDPQHAIRVKTLILRNLYEGEEDKTVLLLFNNAFKKYLTRNKKLAGGILASCLNFTVCFRHLIMNRLTPIEFKKIVKKSNPMILSEWLLSHASKLDGKG